MIAFRPTAALHRALLLGLPMSVLAVFTGRIELLVLALPMVVYLGIAWLGRPNPMNAPALTPRSLALQEGQRAHLGIACDPALPPSTLVCVAWPHSDAVSLDPESGASYAAAGPVASVSALAERWGRYQVGPATAVVQVPTGAFWAVAKTDQVLITVSPQAASLVGPTGVARPIGLAGMHPSTRRGEGSALADIRQFRAGDRLRRIHWRITARTGIPHVVQTSTERDTDILIVCDSLVEVLDPDDDAGSSLDLTVRAVSAISRYYADAGDRVRLHDLGTVIGSLRTGSGRRQARLVLELLARADRQRRRTGRPQLVSELTSGTLVLFCSPLLDARVLAEVGRLRQLGGEIVAVDTLPAGFGRAGHWNSPDAAACALRRLERENSLAGLTQLGIPVVPWRGPASLAAVLLTMQTLRTAPRLVRR